MNHPQSYERDDHVREMIVDLQRASVSTIAFLDDLLLYEKLETERLNMNFSLEDPVAVFHSAIQVYGSKVSFIALTQSNTKRCNVDKARLPVIFAAILNPILLHLPEGQRISIEAEVKALPTLALLSGRTNNQLKVLPEVDQLIIRIRDDFSLRTLKDVQCINEPNVSFERMGHDDDKGSGFGLWIATKLINYHDASICVDEDGDRGLIFTISFPLFVEPNKSSSRGKISDRLRRSLVERFPSPLCVKSAASPKSFNEGAIMDNVFPSRSVDNVLPSGSKSGKVEVQMGNAINPLYQYTPATFSVEGTVSDPVVHLWDSKQSLNLLVVDDSSMVRKMTTRLLQELGHTCFEANDGSTAISLLEEFSDGGQMIDMILMDNQMPIMMGIDATRYIREKLKYQGVIVGVTGNVLEQDIVKFIEYGANEVLMKPLKKETFEECHRRYFFDGKM